MRSARQGHRAKLFGGMLSMALGLLGAPSAAAQDVPAAPLHDPTDVSHDPAEVGDDLDALAAEIEARMREARLLPRGARRAAQEAFLQRAEQLAAQRPGSASWYPLLYAQLGTRRYAEARATATAWITQDPSDWEGHFHLGQALYLDTRWEEAVPVFDRAFERAPSATARRTVGRSAGQVFEKLHRWDDALAMYARIGDDEAIERARADQATHASALHDLELGCALPELSAEETAQLEAELRALEDPSSR